MMKPQQTKKLFKTPNQDTLQDPNIINIKKKP